MRSPRVAAAVLLLALLQSCGKSRAEPTERTPDSPTPFAVAWLEGFGSTENDFPYQHSAGSAERVTVVGTSAGSIDLGQGVLAPEDGFAPFFVQLNGTGESVYSAMARTLDNQEHVAIATDDEGGAVLVGGFGGIVFDAAGRPVSSDTLEWGELHLVVPTPGSNASYVVRLAGDGAPVWGHAFAAGSAFGGPSVALDADGSVLWAGNGAYDTDFGNGPQSGDVFLVKLDSTGQLVWSKVFSKSAAESSVTALGVAVDSAGNAVLLGTFSSAVDFGAGPLSPAGGRDVFVAKFDADGNLMWNRRAGGYRGGVVEGGIAVGPDDEIAVTAPFDEVATFGVEGKRDEGWGNVLVAKLEADGTPAFIRRAGGVSGAGVAIDGAGRVVVTGKGTPEGVPEPSSENQLSYVVEYDSGGRVTRYLSLTGDSVYAESVTVSAEGSVFVTGRFRDEVTAGERTLSGAGAFDCFVARLEP